MLNYSILRIPLLGLAHSALQTAVTYLSSVTAEEGYPGKVLYHYGAALRTDMLIPGHWLGTGRTSMEVRRHPGL